MISIIVPVYNVESYLEKCVKSIMQQSYKDIEIILVDDGSTDKSGNICDELAKREKRIKVIHKLNGGLSSARNAGIEIAKGEYLGFIDSDDYIDEDMYKVLYENINKYQADISMCGMFNCYSDKDHIIQSDYQIELYDRRSAIDLVMRGNNGSVSAVNKLYRRNIFKDLRYPVGKTMEDAYVILDILNQCNKIVLDTRDFYYYVHRKNSITTSDFSLNNMNYILAYEKNYDIIKVNYPDMLDLARFRLCWAHFKVLSKMVMSNTVDSKLEKDVIKYLKKNLRFILGYKEFSSKRKISLLLLLISKKLFKFTVELEEKNNLKLFD